MDPEGLETTSYLYIDINVCKSSFQYLKQTFHDRSFDALSRLS